MGTFVKPTLDEFDHLLKTSLGWERNICGKEYVYDYQMKTFPDIIIKVLTSIKTDTDNARKVGQDAIRIYVVRKVKKGFVGYAKSLRVNRTMNWRDNVVKAFMKQRFAILTREKR